MAERLTARLAELVDARVPLVHVTVVRAQRPTSALPGDEAIVTGDGRIEGFVGGDCARESVRVAALDALKDGEPLLLRVLPDGEQPYPDAPGARVVVNPCLSGGALEIFLEPVLPPPLIRVIGQTPIAVAVRSCAEALGYEVVDADPGDHDRPVAAVLISSHGGDEAADIRTALDAGTPFVGLVASTRRGQGVLSALTLTAAERARIHTPVGVEIGARTPAEVGLSIMAAVVRAVRVEHLVAPAPGEPSAPAPGLVSAVDPVCGMTVVIAPGTPHVVLDGYDHWFCSAGCRRTFAGESAHEQGDLAVTVPAGR